MALVAIADESPGTSSVYDPRRINNEGSEEQ